MGDQVTGMPEHFNEKEEQNRQRDQRYSEHVHDLEDTDASQVL